MAGLVELLILLLGAACIGRAVSLGTGLVKIVWAVVAPLVGFGLIFWLATHGLMG